jgi:hypothetical protein
MNEIAQLVLDIVRFPNNADVVARVKAALIAYYANLPWEKAPTPERLAELAQTSIDSADQIVRDAGLSPEGRVGPGVGGLGGGAISGGRPGDFGGGLGINPNVGAPLTSATEIQAETRPMDVFRRFQLGREGFSGVPQFLQRKLLTDQRAADAFTRFNIMGSGGGVGGVGAGQTFFDFLGGGAPSAGDLRTGVGEISSILGLDEPSAPQGRRIAQFIEPGQQFGAAVQPTLSEVAPSLRNAFRSWATNLYSNFRAQQPGENFLPYAQQRGFF